MNRKHYFKRISIFMVWVFILGFILPIIPVHQEKAFASTAPAAPIMMMTMPMNSEVILSWASSAGATSYEVYEGTFSGSYGGSPVGTVSGSTTNFIATGLTNGTTYYFAVKAVNSSGSSGYSNEMSDFPTSGAGAYTVNYDGNGNTGGYIPVDTGMYTPPPFGSPATILDNTENLTKTGYCFAGWNTQSGGGGTPYAAGDTLTIGSANVTLYAQWQTNCTVAFNSNGGSAVASETVTYNTYATEPTAPTKTSYTFGGWYSDSGLTSAFNFATTPIISNTTLYANWASISSYTVTFDKNVGDTDASPTTKTATAGSNVGTLPTAPTKAGYTFAGWNAQANGGGSTFTATTTVNSNLTVYAEWTANNYTVTYDPNGSSSGTAPTDNTNYHISDTMTVANNSGNLTKSGYTFAGWNTQADGKGTDYAAGSTYTFGASNVTLYAKWTLISSYTVTFDKNGGDIDASPTTKTATAGSNIGTLPTAPTRAGYTFAGWNTQANGGGSTFTATTAVNNNLTVYAQWTVNSYTVTFNSNGGSTVTAQTVQYNNTASKPSDPTKSGYTFVGWYSDSGLSTSYNFSTPVTGNLTLYAKWQLNTPPVIYHPPTYTITYNGNGNTGGSVPTDSNSYQQGTSVSIDGNTGNLTKTGYTFAGWNTKADGSGTTYNAGDKLTIGSANVKLYALWQSGPIITTIAGTGSAGYTGDGGPADKANLYNPYGVAVDSNGNVYIADYSNNRIRKIAADGTISTVAGTGVSGFSGDGGPANKAQLNNPGGIAIDKSGNVYIADRYNNRIRKVATDGTISTIAGTGVEGYSGDGGPADKAIINSPIGITVDSSGNVFFADRYNNRIRKISTDGTISTVAGTGTNGYSGDGGPADKAQLNWPFGVAVDSSGNLYISDFNNNRVRKVASDGTISTVAGTGSSGYSGDGGPATKAQLSIPAAIAIDSSGNLYITEYGGSRIRKVAPDGTITTVAGTGSRGYSGDGGPADKAVVNRPLGVAVDSSGNVYIAGTFNNRIRKVTMGNLSPAVVDAKAPTITKQPEGAEINVGESATLSVTASVDSGTLSYQWYKSDTDNNSGGNLIDGAISSKFDVPTKDGGTTYYYVVVTNTDSTATGKQTASTTSSAVLVTVNEGPIITTIAGTDTSGYSGDGGPADKAKLSEPSGVAVDSSGNVYIGDQINNRIRKIATDGTITTVAGMSSRGYSGDGGPADKAQLNWPFGVAVDSSGNVYIADLNNRIRKIATDGTISTIAGTGVRGYSGDGGPADKAKLSEPSGVAVDSSGNVYIADTFNNRIRKIATDGTISTIAGTGGVGHSGDGDPAVKAELDRPFGVAVDNNGNVYIADSENGRVRKVTPDGTISTIAGTGVEGYSGDGGPANKAQIMYPTGVAVDSSGNVYIADRSNNRIRKIAMDGTISTIAGTGVMGYSGDGGPANKAKLKFPSGVAVDSSGNVYIADWVNNRIRKVTMNTENDLGTVTHTKVNGQSTTTLVVNDQKLQNQVNSKGKNGTITIQNKDKSDKLKVKLSVTFMQTLQCSKVSLELQNTFENSFAASLGLNANQIKVTSTCNPLSAYHENHSVHILQYSPTVVPNKNAGDGKIIFEIAKPLEETQKNLEAAAQKKGFQLVGEPVKFSIKVEYPNKTVDLNHFNSYVHQTISLPEGVDPKQVTTALVLTSDGTLRQEPTKIVQKNGKYYAYISSTINGTVALVTHSVSFKDVQNHWAKQAVNDLGSRMILSGIGNNEFVPNQNITRAEFAVMLVRALGLEPVAGTSSFKDVKSTDWYSSAVETAYEYHLISGYADGTFRPKEKLTREEAMVILSRAMKLTGLKTTLSESETDQALQKFGDRSKVSKWAKSGIAASLKSGIIAGKGKNQLAPKLLITRAEVATILERLLKKSGLF